MADGKQVTTYRAGRPPTNRRATGRGAQVLKYDILTALGTHACHGDKHLQRLTLRFVTLIVARYNWGTDDLTIGQREIAALWAIDERSVKREMARLRELGWILCHRPAARGRVASYGLGLEAILRDTRAAWDHVGSDFVARMAGQGDGQAGPDVPPSNVIPLPRPQGGAGLWAQMQARLFAEDAHLFNAWFAALREEATEGHTLCLVAPSRFHASYLTANHHLRLTRMAQGIDPQIERVEVVVSGN